MIDKEKITIDWITKVSKENRNADKILVKKVIGDSMNAKLNRLKKSKPEAFFYWFKIYELEKK
ncbi:MAG: hypothetical protein Q8N03_12155 [Ignavibacteria bacterium]|nr:hypothetical protein [Ignavibacteria bacterium]MDP3832145.1 hypothetical protein [Ignavibacteriaceae bacterium]